MHEDLMMFQHGAGGPDLELASAALNAADAVHHATARDRFQDIEPGISVKQGMNRFNSEFFRPGEATPKRKNECIFVCDLTYRYNPIIKFAIDMMTDFVTQGVQIYHPSAKHQKTYRHWWRKVGGREVSERLVNYLLRHGVAICKRNFADLNTGDLRDLDSGVSNAASLPPVPFSTWVDTDIEYGRSPRVKKNRIPLLYTFLNPGTVEVLGGELAMFGSSMANPLRYGLNIPAAIHKVIKNPKTPEEKEVVAKLPKYITDAIGAGKKMVPLDPEKVSVHYYKKDDWQLWPDPMILSILKDVNLYDKMKDADRAALDGSISRIRLWNLGQPEHQLQPGPGAFKKLRDQLLANVGGGAMDLIWDSTLKLTESSTDVYNFLGAAKYEPVLQTIFCGLGLPQSLTGSAGGGGGMTNNALSLKTLIERLQYARNILDEFWAREFYFLQKAFGHKKPAQLQYNMMSLSDEASEHMIWVQLFDRNVVTAETMRERFGVLNDVEVRRLRREYKQAGDGTMPAKLGPFAEAQPHPDQMAKAAMQQGTIAPSEAGVVRKPKARGDKSLLDIQGGRQDKTAEQKATIKGDTSAGRPRGVKEKGKRKQRTPKPRSSAGLIAAQVRGREVQHAVAQAVTPLFLEAARKKNLRGLSTAQAADLEGIKFAIMCSIPPGEAPTADLIGSLHANPPAPLGQTILDHLNAQLYGQRGTAPTLDELRELQVAAYALLHTEPDHGDPDTEG